MIKNFKTPAELQAQIQKLKQEKELLRLFLHEVIEAFYKTVNKNCSKETKSPFNPNLEPLFKIFSGLKPCPNCSRKNNPTCKSQTFSQTNPNECAWTWMSPIFKDIYAKTKPKKEKNHE